MSSNTTDISPVSVSGLLPLFQEKAANASMLKHGINIIKAAIEKLNPGQIPVVTGDQPIFALLKLIQSKYPNLYGEDKLVVMMGGLHIEMAAQAQVGKLLAGSGIENILVESGVTTPGRVQSFLSCSHMKRTRLLEGLK